MLLSGIVEPVKAEPMKVEPVKTPVAHVDPFLDIELETTMKRPAIRLQPMQQRPASQGNQPASVIQGRTGEWLASKEARGSMSHRERLLKGYQHQLVGDYDEAMQEYRLIIRNVPELLGEVISNIRALLKLAPKYAAGYRVLGDAYMCQGEYLQAMEAYNKALTMAKKAKA
jgi:tetratricopeptide (TPR) repeat protein